MYTYIFRFLCKPSFTMRHPPAKVSRNFFPKTAAKKDFQ